MSDKKLAADAVAAFLWRELERRDGWIYNEQAYALVEAEFELSELDRKPMKGRKTYPYWKNQVDWANERLRFSVPAAMTVRVGEDRWSAGA